MRYRKLGRTGLVVSEICLGTMTFGGDGFWKVIGALQQKEVGDLVKSAFDKGVTFIRKPYFLFEVERHIKALLAEPS